VEEGSGVNLQCYCRVY